MKFTRYEVKFIILILIIYFASFGLYSYSDSFENRKILSEINKRRNNLKNAVEKLANKSRYIQYRCDFGWCGGWADRLDGIVSALAVALIQDRKFLIHISKPCMISTHLDSNLIKWDETAPANLKEYSIHAIDDFNIQKNMKTLDLENYLTEYDLITIRNNQDWLKSLSQNEKISKKIKQLGYKQEEFRPRFLFKEWYSGLFKLKPHLEFKHKQFLKIAKPNKNTKLICAQLRLGGNFRNNRMSDYKFNDMEDVKQIWKFMRKTFLSKFKSKNDYRIFVTTDHEDAQDDAAKEFANENIIINSGPIFHIDIDTITNCDQIEKTILDFHCLQNCDMAVITHGAFGKFGLWNRDRPIENLYLYYLKQFSKFNSSDSYFFYTT